MLSGLPNVTFLYLAGTLRQYFTQRNHLYNKDEPWVKKGESNFDVTKGACDWTEVCELIGIFIMSLLSKHVN